MSLLTIAYPKLNDEDFLWIQNYREKNDELYFNLVAPHFTIVFPVFDFSSDAFVEEIEAMSKGINQIYFEIKCATINKDSFIPYYHEFLVPDKGFSDIVKLHDKLYSEKLFSNLRMEIDFIPHIGIGNSKEVHVSKKRVDDLNKTGICISGQITHLDIVFYENNKIEIIKRISLST
ncbi:MAG: 2'-5' RNA ligase family protein [bacterium]